MDERRDEFLLAMYNQLLNDINRHIMVVWQSVGVLVGAFAILALVEKNLITLDLAVAVVVLLCGWLGAHLIDAGYWYNRNLAIISNIERQFLLKSDLQDIQNYFGVHRPKNKMIRHLRIQFALGIGVALLLLVFHFVMRVAPGLRSPWSDFEFFRAMPYVIGLVVALYCWHEKTTRDEEYIAFVRTSPGKHVDTGDIVYGPGHGFPRITRPPKKSP